MVVRSQFGDIGFDSPGWVLMSGGTMPCRQAFFLVYTIWYCVGVSADRLPYIYGLSLDGNDPLLLRSS